MSSDVYLPHLDAFNEDRNKNLSICKRKLIYVLSEKHVDSISIAMKKYINL